MLGINIKIKSHFVSPQRAQGLEMMNVGEKIIVNFVYTRITNKSHPIYPLCLHFKLTHISNSIFVIKFSLLNMY